MEEKREKMQRKFKPNKFLSIILILALLLNPCMASTSLASRYGNYGVSGAWESFGVAFLIGCLTVALAIIAGPNAMWASIAGTVAADLTGLYIYFFHYHDSGAPFEIGGQRIELFGTTVSKGQMYSMLAGVAAAAIAGIAQGVASAGKEAGQGVAGGGAENASGQIAEGTTGAAGSAAPTTTTGKWVAQQLNKLGQIEFFQSAANPFAKYGFDMAAKGSTDVIIGRAIGMATVHLAGDVLIGTLRLYASEGIKNYLEDEEGWDETVAGVVGELGGLVGAAAITPAVRYVFKGGPFNTKWKISNTGGYINDKEYAALVNANNLGRQKVYSGDSGQVTVADAAQGQMIIQELDPASGQPIIGPARPVGINEVQLNGAPTYNGGRVEVVGITVPGNQSLIPVNNVNVLREVQSFRVLITSAGLSNLLNLTGGVMANVRGTPLNQYLDTLPVIGTIPAGLMSIHNLGLAPFVTAGVKLAILKSLNYKTYYGDKKDKLEDNLWKMALADAAGNLAASAVMHSNVINSIYGLTISKQDVEGNKKIIFNNPWTGERRGMSLLSTAEYFQTMLKETALQGGIFLSRVGWGHYAIHNRLDPNAGQVLHLSSMILASSALDVAFRQMSSVANPNNEPLSGVYAMQPVGRWDAPGRERDFWGYIGGRYLKEFLFLSARAGMPGSWGMFFSDNRGLNAYQTMWGIQNEFASYANMIGHGQTPIQAYVSLAASHMDDMANQVFADSLANSLSRIWLTRRQELDQGVFINFQYRDYARQLVNDEITSIEDQEKLLEHITSFKNILERREEIRKQKKDLTEELQRLQTEIADLEQRLDVATEQGDVAQVAALEVSLEKAKDRMQTAEPVMRITDRAISNLESAGAAVLSYYVRQRNGNENGPSEVSVAALDQAVDRYRIYLADRLEQLRSTGASEYYSNTPQGRLQRLLNYDGRGSMYIRGYSRLDNGAQLSHDANYDQELRATITRLAANTGLDMSFIENILDNGNRTGERYSYQTSYRGVPHPVALDFSSAVALNAELGHVRTVINNLEKMEPGGINIETADTAKIIEWVQKLRRLGGAGVENIGFSMDFLPALNQQSSEAEVEAARRILVDLSNGVQVYTPTPQISAASGVDFFGRRTWTRYFKPEYHVGVEGDTTRWIAAPLEKRTMHYYNQFGHAFAETKDYSQIRMPENWPSKKIEEIVSPGRSETRTDVFRPDTLFLQHTNREIREESARIINGGGFSLGQLDIRERRAKIKEDDEFRRAAHIATERTWGQGIHANFNSIYWVTGHYLATEVYAQEWASMSQEDRIKFLRERVLPYTQLILALNTEYLGQAHNNLIIDRAVASRTGVNVLVPTYNYYTHPGGDAVQVLQRGILQVPLLTSSIDIPAVTQSHNEYGAIKIGPNITYEADIYTPGSANTPYAGPVSSLQMNDIMSGPYLKPQIYYVPSGDLAGDVSRIGQNIFRQIFNDISQGVQNEEILAKLKRTGIKQDVLEDFIKKIRAANIDSLREEFTTFQTQVNEYLESDNQVGLAQLFNLPQDKIKPIFNSLRELSIATATESQQQAYRDTLLGYWSNQELNHLYQATKFATAIQSAQGLVESKPALRDYFRQDLLRVQDYTFYNNVDIGGRNYTLPRWGLTNAYDASGLRSFWEPRGFYYNRDTVEAIIKSERARVSPGTSYYNRLNQVLTQDDRILEIEGFTFVRPDLNQYGYSALAGSLINYEGGGTLGGGTLGLEGLFNNGLRTFDIQSEIVIPLEDINKKRVNIIQEQNHP